MISIFKRNNWFLTKVIIFTSLAIPLGITLYETVILGKNSVVFLGDFHPDVGMVVVIYYLVLLLVGIIWVVLQLRSLLKLKSENKKNELLHLQSQVNPHFFFNMLNNLYGMVDKDTEKSKALILKLSDLMRYSIYEGEKRWVTLEEEVSYLKNYIELHEMRYHKKLDIQFNHTIEDDTTKVMPLLFIILVENAFKHGVENLRQDAFVHMNLQSDTKGIVFEIENNYDTDELPKEIGIGLKNLERRLALAYPKKYHLTYTNDTSIYKAHLELHK